jgi:hypothetical protein
MLGVSIATLLMDPRGGIPTSVQFPSNPAGVSPALPDLLKNLFQSWTLPEHMHGIRKVQNAEVHGVPPRGGGVKPGWR